MPYSAIGKRPLPAGLSVVQLLPQTPLDVVNGHARFLIEGEALRPYSGWPEEIYTYTLDTLDEYLRGMEA